jgi:peptidoglycan/xylan/chitin deacetylase (PgdA/CDA1 family)
MYHAFDTREVGDRYVISAKKFRRQLGIISLLGYRVIGLGEFIAAMRDGGELPNRPVVITIDDGYRDNLEVAAPILRERGLKATVFIVSGRIGKSNNWDETGAVAGRELVDESHAAFLRRAGLEIGAHTRTHASLIEVDDAAVIDEVSASRAELDGLLDDRQSTFAYPYGQFDDRSVAAVEEAGFRGAVTVENRLARLSDHPMLIPRIEIRGSESLASFLRKLWIGGA